MISERNKILITGVSGLLGSNLAYYFKDKYDILRKRKVRNVYSF
jgi:nucleoside-diphosphate-sugar epimerase